MPPLLTQRGGELLRALEHIAAKIVRLETEEHDNISFDANNFKALRARELKLAAETAAERVRRTGQPYSFAPMSSRERRMLHLAFRDYAGSRNGESGEGLRRFVVVSSQGLRQEQAGCSGKPAHCAAAAADVAELHPRYESDAAIARHHVQPDPHIVYQESLANETIVAIATPPGRGGIGIVRLSGPEAPEIAKLDAYAAQSAGPCAGPLC